MKKMLLPVIACMVFWGCDKSAPDNYNPNPIYNTPVRFEIYGVHDTIMESNAYIEFPIEVAYVSGTKQNVSITFTGLPNNVTLAVFPNKLMDTPTFTRIIRLTTINAIPGVYTNINLIGVGQGDTLVRAFPMTLTIVPHINAAEHLVGTYTETGSCVQLGAVNNASVFVSVTTGGVDNKITLERVWDGNINMAVKADMDTSNHTLNIPYQFTNGKFVIGSGSYTNTQMNISYHLSDGGLVNDTCVTVLNKQ